MNILDLELDDGHSNRSRTQIGQLAAAFILLGALVGCSQAPEDSTQTVDYYRAHAKERKALVARCANDPGRLGNKSACINAQQAEGIESLGHFSNLPPMGLSDDKSSPAKVGPPHSK